MALRRGVSVAARLAGNVPADGARIPLATRRATQAMRTGVRDSGLARRVGMGRSTGLSGGATSRRGARRTARAVGRRASAFEGGYGARARAGKVGPVMSIGQLQQKARVGSPSALRGLSGRVARGVGRGAGAVALGGVGLGMGFGAGRGQPAPAPPNQSMYGSSGGMM